MIPTSWDWSVRANRFLTGSSGIRIGLRLRMPFVWLAGLLALVLLLPDRVWTTLLVGLLGLVLVSLMWSRALAVGLSAGRHLRFGWVAVGDRLEEEFTLVNRSSLPALWVEIRDESNVPGYQVAAARAVGAGDRVHWRQSSVCSRRGQYHLGPWELVSGDPFGIFSVSRRYEQTQELIIHPPIHGNIPIPLPSGRIEGRARARERTWHANINAAGVREYHHDDPLNWIHWPTTARRDSLFVRQFDRDASGDIWLLLDCSATAQLGEGIDGTEEHAVLLAASLAARALTDMRGVGLAAYGRQPQIVPPGLGEGQQWRLLRALALLHADGDNELARAMRELADTARRGAAVLIITSTGNPDWLPELPALTRRGLESHVLLLERSSFGGGDSSEGLRHAVSLLGYRCQLIRRGELGKPIRETEHQGFWEFRVTGTGKAVAVRRPVEV